jgi:Zinc carboxypeptidase
VASSVVRAQQKLDPIWPGAKYDPAIPTIQQVLGHDTGMEITPPDQVADYLQALARAAPTRTRLIEYARSWENRPLWLMVIGSPERIAKLDAVKRDLQRLADPRGLSSADADRLVKEAPVVTWLVHGVHGNEISSSDAALFEAYHLLAVQGDADIDLVFRESLVLIDPMQNPDGRARFVFQNLQGRAAIPDPTPYNAEHDEPWPGGRSNHYLFDMNRDWFAQTQPETRGRITIGREYWPHVTVDLHEQGGDNNYYFAPPAEPVNPHITQSQRRAWDLFGRANGARFDQRGWAYFIAEVYDAFYPGYGDSWPTFNGSIGMTYEQPSARALSFARDDGTVMTYRDGVMRHANAAITTVITAARNRERLVREFLDYRRSAIAEGAKGTGREYILAPGADPSRAALLARNLATQGIEVRRAEEGFTVAKRQFPAGTHLVSLAQPTGRLIRNLLDPQTEQPADFIKRQEERRAKRLNDQIYDVTAWNLPMLYDVDLVTSPTAINVRSTAVPMAYPPTGAGSPGDQTGGDAALPARTFAQAKVAYLMPWGSAAAALAAEALQQGIRMHSVGGAFTLNGRTFPIGTAVIRLAGNPADLHARLTTLATTHGAEIVPTDTTYIEAGTSLGSNETANLKAPRVLLVWDTPTASLSAGWTRYTLERRYGQPVTVVRTASLARANFADFDVIVLPSGNYGNSITEAVLNRIKDWLRAGGTLVTLAEATRWATGSTVGLISTTGLLKDGRPDTPVGAGGAGGAGGGGNASPGKPAEFDYDKAIQPDRERPASQPGAILRVLLETDHWLSAGHDDEMYSMIEGNRVFAPLKLDNGRNVGRWASKDRLIASGLIWPEAQDILVQKPYLMHQPFGQGHVVAFAEDANYRAYSEGSMLLFMNAVLLGPGY